MTLRGDRRLLHWRCGLCMLLLAVDGIVGGKWCLWAVMDVSIDGRTKLTVSCTTVIHFIVFYHPYHSPLFLNLQPGNGEGGPPEIHPNPQQESDFERIQKRGRRIRKTTHQSRHHRTEQEGSRQLPHSKRGVKEEDEEDEKMRRR